MSVRNARRFLAKIENDDEFKLTLEQAAGYNERFRILRQMRLEFNEYEIDSAYLGSLSRCQFEYQGLILNDIYVWWKILNEERKHHPA